MPNSIDRIEILAFGYCTGLSYVEFEDNNEVDIWSGAFANCWELTCVILPNGIKHISGFSFGGCPKLEDIFIPGTVTGIGVMAFCGVAAEQIDLPDSIKNIDSQAFYNSKLTSVSIPNSVLTIDESAFGLCYGLKSVEIGDSVVCIGSKAFEDCHALSEVTFRSTIIGSIGTYVFKGCKNLKRINVPASAMSQ